MDNVSPINYKICLEPDLKNFKFSGTTEILMETSKHVSEVVLNAADLALWGCKVYVDGSDDTNSRVGTLADIGNIDNAGDLTIGRNSQATHIFYKGYLGLLTIIKGVAWTDAQHLDFYQQTRHLFGV